MHIEFDRRHTLYFDIEGNIRPLSPHRLDRLWRGESDAAIPELARRRVRFAVLHIERFTSPPRVALEHYPVLTFDADGNLDLDLQRAQLEAAVDHLEATDYAPAPALNCALECETAWHPDASTRQRLIKAATPSYRTRMAKEALHSWAEEPRHRAAYGRAPATVSCHPPRPWDLGTGQHAGQLWAIFPS